MLDYISYLGVSTDKQGTTALGMDARREAVCRYVQNRGQIIAEFIEVESGKCHTNRPQLLAALAQCRKRRAVLLIARLDRLAGNVAFIANLMDSDVEFVAVDTGAAPGRFPQSQTPSNRKPLRVVCRPSGSNCSPHPRSTVV